MPVPSRPIIDPLIELRWGGGSRPASALTAALITYVALAFCAQEEREPAAGITLQRVAAVTYDRLQSLTGLSRAKVSQALAELIERQLVLQEGSTQRRQYALELGDGRWFKLPCRRLVSHERILPFTRFNLRSKHELHAMKLYLYLASVRDNKTEFSVASYEKIYRQTGIPERDIRRAISALLGVELLHNVQRESSTVHPASRDGEFGPNRYYLAGYQDLFSGLRSSEQQAVGAG